jgi:hypothetical protein
MRSLLQDLGYGLRMLRKTPGFTAVAVITLALGIGANTAIFSLINAIMLRTLPVKDPQSLVMLKWSALRFPNTVGTSNYSDCPRDLSRPEGCSFSLPMFRQIQSGQHVFSDVSAFVPTSFTVNANGQTSRVQGSFVSESFFRLLGASPSLGRLIDPVDDSNGASPSAVISYQFWLNSLSGDPAVIGKLISINKQIVTVSGVAKPNFLGLDPAIRTDLWLPLSALPLLEGRAQNATLANSLWLELLARLKPLL